MQITRGRILALVIAIVYLATTIALSGSDAKDAAVICLILSLPLAFIWFPDEIAEFSNIAAKSGYGRIDTGTPPLMLTIIGWLCLVGYLPLLAYLLHHK